MRNKLKANSIEVKTSRESGKVKIVLYNLKLDVKMSITLDEELAKNVSKAIISAPIKKEGE